VSSKLINIIQPLVEQLGYEFVGLEQSRNPGNPLLRIYIDRPPQGVDVDDCATISREVAAVLDVEDPISSRYVLEVSSPGLDRPLFTLEQYRRFIGEQVKISLFAPVGQRRKVSGCLLEVADTTVTIEQDSEPLCLDFDNIAKARLIPDYEALMQQSGR